MRGTMNESEITYYWEWKHRNGRTYRRRAKPVDTFTVPAGCVDYRYVATMVNDAESPKGPQTVDEAHG